MCYTADMNINILFSDELIAAIEDFRFRRKFKTRADAIRWLLESALKQAKKGDKDGK